MIKIFYLPLKLPLFRNTNSPNMKIDNEEKKVKILKTFSFNFSPAFFYPFFLINSESIVY